MCVAHQNAHFKGKTAPGLAELLLVIKSWEWNRENWSFVYWRCTPLGWAARLLTCLAAMERALFLILPPTITIPSPAPCSLTHSLSLSLSLCMAAASPPADTCPAVTGGDVRWAADARIDLPPFTHKLHIKLLETLEETKNGRRDGDWGWGMLPEWKGEEGEYCQLPSPLQTNNVWCSEGIENTKLTVLLVMGEGSFAQLLLSYNTTPKTRFPNATNSSYFSWASLNFLLHWRTCGIKNKSVHHPVNNKPQNMPD